MASFTPTPRRPLGVALELWKWGFTGAVGAGCAWALGILLGRVLLDYDISKTEGSPRFLVLELRAAALGLLVGSISAAVVLRPVAIAVLYWGPVLAVTAVSGCILSGVATQELRGFFPSQMSSSLGFAISGFFAGLCGYGWLQLTGKPATQPAEDEDTVAQPPSKGSSVRPATSRSGSAAACLQTFLILVAVVSSLAGAEMLANANLSLGVLAGLFGISVSLALWNQEQRLRDLEAALPRKREP